MTTFFLQECFTYRYAILKKDALIQNASSDIFTQSVSRIQLSSVFLGTAVRL